MIIWYILEYTDDTAENVRESMHIDEPDRKILSILLRAATTPKAEIARAIGFAASVISERIKRLEQ